MRTPIDIARELDAYGFNVLPVRFKEKAPLVPWKKYQNIRSTSKLESWFGGSAASNFFVVCGQISGCCVLDIDSPQGEKWAEVHIGRDVLDTTTCAKTSKGHHYYFRLTKEHGDVRGWSKHDEEADFDFRAEGGGVVAPPSLHASGEWYRWIRTPDVMLPVPEVMLVPLGESVGNNNGSKAPKGGRSKLADLLKSPPDEGGRNDWLARVAGHYAKVMEHEDAYAESVLSANQKLRPPLPAVEVEKTAVSIWRAEQDGRRMSAGLPADQNGWLIGRDDRLWTTTLLRMPDNTWQENLEAWSDFDIHALGIVVTNEGRYYEVEVTRPGHAIQRDQLEHSVLGSQRGLNTWLAGHGCTVLPPNKEKYRVGTISGRLQRYLESQNPQRVVEIERLGWTPGIGFVTHEGVITKHGFSEHLEIAPKRQLQTWCPVKYGFEGDIDEARDVLSQVMTFHDEHITAVYGSWMMACMMKPFIEEQTGWFPFMIIEGPSETGKTNGYFAMMQQLCGNSEGAVIPTQAVLRDSLSAHNATPIWIDDLTDPERILDKMRQAAMGGSESKKSGDNSADERVKMTRPLVISGEGFPGLHTDKALLDRAVILEVPSVIRRESLLRGRLGESQWDDVQELWRQYGRNLTKFAGHIVQLVAKQEHIISMLPDLRTRRGRVGEKQAMLRVGAHLLEAVLEREGYLTLVEGWFGSPNTATDSDYPFLILEALPSCLMDGGHLPRNALGSSPVFVERGLNDQPIVWWNDQLLANWLKKQKLTPRQQDQSTKEALKAQRLSLGVDGDGKTKQTSVGYKGERTQARYHCLAYELSRVVMDKAQYHKVWTYEDDE